MQRKLLNSIFIGKPKQSGNILIFPMYGENQIKSEYFSFKPLTKAFEDDAIIIKEKEPADVNELSFKNLGQKPVFIMDGEYLQGAKQDRTVNLSILAPTNKEITLPVSCVEAGRWSNAKNRTFIPYDKLHYINAKAERHAYVSRSFDKFNKAESNQREVWEQISNKESIMHQRSRTKSMKDMYERNQKKLAAFTRDLQSDNTQIGSLYCVNDKILGFDIFYDASLHKFYSSKIIHSIAIDAMETNPVSQTIKIDYMEMIESFLAEVKALVVKKYNSIGIGSNYRSFNDSISASSLILDDNNIHSCAFLVDRTSSIGIIK